MQINAYIILINENLKVSKYILVVPITVMKLNNNA